ncbi:TA system VapC family ribonuclease toxin [Aeoliella sp. SH292]|uniref:TA system VapC family ribonuclease toxin n=1 Tax=Aeoliella sp. SH292 TaxID=3454464 RepID=UPI003F9E27FA
MTKIWLPDVNVWLAMAFDGHAHHEVARSWFNSLSDDVCLFCRASQQGFLRIATNPRVFRGSTLTMAEAWGAYDLFLSDERVQFAPETYNVELEWRKLTVSDSFSPQVWTDAYLVAFAITLDASVVTFDQALSRLSAATFQLR